MLITILGPTACGKTKLAVSLAGKTSGEIISADSRQVYRGMDLGTGKDLEDYFYNGQPVPYHLIDIVKAGYKYNVYEYQKDFVKVYQDIVARGKQPVLCGGTGLYLESVLKGYELKPVPQNDELRKSLENKSLEDLTKMLSAYKTLHNNTDTDTVKRAIRAIEIEEYYLTHKESDFDFPELNPVIFGLDLPREERRERISKRLTDRIKSGMIEEVETLLKGGIDAEDLIYYGLEYKYLTLFITGKLSLKDMTEQLEIAIHQFAKRQMTWFRGMERRGIKINWLNALDEVEENVEKILAVTRVC
jgi:tRNA dimethylallyltransferase